MVGHRISMAATVTGGLAVRRSKSRYHLKIDQAAALQGLVWLNWSGVQDRRLSSATSEAITKDSSPRSNRTARAFHANCALANGVVLG
jgi:hypothetical protein